MDFEKLGAFYLGKEFDLSRGQLLDQPLLYDARDLTTHAVCVGMTGSGKTGLCIDLLEEAAIDQVPALIIDPKGDISNLLLQFPDLEPRDFEPWVNPDDARRKGMTLSDYSASQAALWKKGLADWGQSGERIARLRASADFRIYTPGSQAGHPVSLLQTFQSPGLEWDRHGEELRDRIEGTVTALLGLLDIEADPIRSREHILLSSVIEQCWREGKDLDLQSLILAIQDPPVQRLGVFEVDTFFPPKDRFELAMALNSIIASPSFASWLQGDPLDIARFLTTEKGQPRHSIFSIAHLTEPERVFFVTMLLNQLIGWMRRQEGTTSLRAILYMDEIFGFFPPIANPPSKKPMLTLLKQARAYGLGLLLATQNPVDLDYKGLTNAGTWFIGRLQAERDKERLIGGLLSSTGGKEAALGRKDFQRIISDLGKRVFLLHNVHEDAPVTFQTRWAMSYLRGPLTKEQIRSLTKKEKRGEGSPSPAEVSLKKEEQAVSGGSERDPDKLFSATPPALPPSVDQVFLRLEKTAAVARLEAEKETGDRLESAPLLVYSPALWASGVVHFIDRRRKVEEKEDFSLLLPVPAGSDISWDRAVALETGLSKISGSFEEGARFAPLPGTWNEASELQTAEKELSEFLYRERRLLLYKSEVFGEYSRAGESERDFKLRLTQLAREQRDEEVEKLQAEHRDDLYELKKKLARAELQLQKKEADASSRSRELLVSVGESLLGMFLGRRSMRSASGSLTKYRMKSSAEMAREQAEQKLEELRAEADRLNQALEEGTREITRKWEERLSDLQEVWIHPRRNDAVIERLGVAWYPRWLFPTLGRVGREDTVLIDAY